jgi:hypothetical protein
MKQTIIKVERKTQPSVQDNQRVSRQPSNIKQLETKPKQWRGNPTYEMKNW